MLDDSNIHSGHRKRLKEKFINNKESFTDHELLELLLTYSIPRKNTNDIAHKLINKFGSLQGVLTANPVILKDVESIGDNSATLLNLVGYINSKISINKDINKNITSIEEAKNYLIDLFKNCKTEMFYVVFLNKQNKVINITKNTNENKSMVEVDMQKLSADILTFSPASIIVAHNHFAKYPSPSKQDDSVTAKIYMLLQLYKVNFYDHLIISGEEVYSYFFDNKLQNIKDNINNKLF